MMILFHNTKKLRFSKYSILVSLELSRLLVLPMSFDQNKNVILLDSDQYRFFFILKFLPGCSDYQLADVLPLIYSLPTKKALKRLID